MTIPDMKPVESSNVKAVGYDPQSRVMHVQFHSGNHYSYADVPPATHEALVKADSVGKHFNQHVMGKYQHSKVA